MNILEINNCTGCMLCVNICPKKCIHTDNVIKKLSECFIELYIMQKIRG